MRSFLFSDNSTLLREADSIVDQVNLSSKPQKTLNMQNISPKQKWQEVFDLAMARYS